MGQSGEDQCERLYMKSIEHGNPINTARDKGEKTKR